MRIVDVVQWRRVFADAKTHIDNVPLRQLLYFGDTRTLGNIPRNGNVSILDMVFNDKTDKFYMVQFTALNGAWKELYHLKLIDGKWREAIRVTDLADKKVMFERVDPLYPRVNGKVDWEQLN